MQHMHMIEYSKVKDEVMGKRKEKEVMELTEEEAFLSRW